MLSKNQIKLIGSLHHKKFRQRHGLFLVEGGKNLLELLASTFEIEMLVLTKEFLQKYESPFSQHTNLIQIATADQVAKMGTLQTNEAGLAVVRAQNIDPFRVRNGEFILILDDVRDPGNLGAILRVADWYGINKIICSETTADFYNPKVISASMGSFTRIACRYENLVSFITNASGKPIIGTFLQGNSLHNFEFPKDGGYVVLGNEAGGISLEVQKVVTHKIAIPKFGDAESLNVGIAAAVVCDAIRRQISH